jgi:hypothetical protein
METLQRCGVLKKIYLPSGLGVKVRLCEALHAEAEP